MNYPLKQTNDEKKRLDNQFKILQSPELNNLIQEDFKILDVGCGTGELLNRLKNKTYYYGLDINNNFKFAVDNERIHFFQSDCTKMDQLFSEMDLVNFRLVLWSLPFWKDIIDKSLSVLKSNGIVFCYEPDDTDLSFSFDLTSLKTLAEEWQKDVKEKGCNPFIGSEIESSLKRSGFKKTQSIKHLIQRDEKDRESLKTSSENLFKIFKNLSYFNQEREELIKSAEREILSINSKSYIQECYYSVWGYKE